MQLLFHSFINLLIWSIFFPLFFLAIYLPCFTAWPLFILCLFSSLLLSFLFFIFAWLDRSLTVYLMCYFVLCVCFYFSILFSCSLNPSFIVFIFYEFFVLYMRERKVFMVLLFYLIEKGGVQFSFSYSLVYLFVTRLFVCFWLIFDCLLKCLSLVSLFACLIYLFISLCVSLLLFVCSFTFIVVCLSVLLFVVYLFVCHLVSNRFLYLLCFLQYLLDYLFLAYCCLLLAFCLIICFYICLFVCLFAALFCFILFLISLCLLIWLIVLLCN